MGRYGSLLLVPQYIYIHISIARTSFSLSICLGSVGLMFIHTPANIYYASVALINCIRAVCVRWCRTVRFLLPLLSQEYLGGHTFFGVFRAEIGTHFHTHTYKQQKHKTLQYTIAHGDLWMVHKSWIRAVLDQWMCTTDRVGRKLCIGSIRCCSVSVSIQREISSGQTVLVNSIHTRFTMHHQPQLDLLDASPYTSSVNK